MTLSEASTDEWGQLLRVGHKNHNRENQADWAKPHHEECPQTGGGSEHINQGQNRVGRPRIDQERTKKGTVTKATV